jgi:hypothetical protein
MAPVAAEPPDAQSGVSLRWIKTRAIFPRVCFCATNHLEFAIGLGKGEAPVPGHAADKHIKPSKEKQMQDNNLIPGVETTGLAAGAEPIREGCIAGRRLRPCPGAADAGATP